MNMPETAVSDFCYVSEADLVFEPRLPLSKSLAARALCLNLMSEKPARLSAAGGTDDDFRSFAQTCDDIRVLSEALERIRSFGTLKTPSSAVQGFGDVLESPLSDSAGTLASAPSSWPLCEINRQGDTLLCSEKEHAPAGTVELDLADSGTALRLLTACLSLRPGCWVLKGSARLCERPMRPLIEALRACGADIRCLEKEGYAPLEIRGKALRGGEVVLDASFSSQFLSALMMAGPCMERGLDIRLVGKAVSRPYAWMTLSMMRIWSVEAEWNDDGFISFAAQRYTAPACYEIEIDWSAASYWFECQSICDDVRIVLKGLSQDSLQGDACLPELFSSLGVTAEAKEGALWLSPTTPQTAFFEADLAACPDLVPALAMTCAIKGIPFCMRGIGHLRFKETDRLEALAEFLRLLGCEAEAGVDTLSSGVRSEEKVLRSDDDALSSHGFSSGGSESVPSLDCRCDHRLVMAAAPLALRRRLRLLRAEGVEKSYPGFWDTMTALLRHCGLQDASRTAFSSGEGTSEEQNPQDAGTSSFNNM